MKRDDAARSGERRQTLSEVFAVTFKRFGAAKERHQKVCDAFAATFELQGTAREDALEQACLGDAETRAEVEALLERNDRDKSFLQTPPLGRVLDLPDLPGDDGRDGCR